jgi:hypothetical protein
MLTAPPLHAFAATPGTVTPADSSPADKILTLSYCSKIIHVLAVRAAINDSTDAQAQRLGPENQS